MIVPLPNWGSFMPITPFLDNARFDPEATRVMGVAFEMTRAALRLTDRDDPIVGAIAKKITRCPESGPRPSRGSRRMEH
jgi:hypothetical protein